MDLAASSTRNGNSRRIRERSGDKCDLYLLICPEITVICLQQNLAIPQLKSFASLQKIASLAPSRLQFVKS